MNSTRQISLASRPTGGQAALANFRLESVPVSGTVEGQVLVRLIWLSLDPYMRGRMDEGRSYIAPFELNAPLEGGAVAEVIKSNDTRFVAGNIVTGSLPWAEHAVVAADGLRKIDPAHGPAQWALGVLGMPGFTAWIGLNEIAQIKAGETVLISAATGAVGSVACQIAKSRGLTVIGTAGGAEKCAYATDVLGYDACIDHHIGDARTLSAAIKEAAPQGIDVYFENVGGKTLSAVVPRINDFGRIALCGMIAWYDGKNYEDALPLPSVWVQILKRRLTVQGFIVTDHGDKLKAFLTEVSGLLAQGKIAPKETIVDGLENAPTAFLGLLEGQNFGKLLVRVGDDP